jgi:hypothetical protein
MLANVEYFKFFCKLVSILNVGPAATKSRLKSGVSSNLLKVEKAIALTALEKLMYSWNLGIK